MHVEIFSDDSISQGSDSINDLYIGQAMLPSAKGADDGIVPCSFQLKISEEHLLALVESLEAHPGSCLALRMHIQCRHMKRDGLVRNVSSSRIPDSSLLLLEECNCLLEWISAVSPV
jgi:hypothetical protein